MKTRNNNITYSPALIILNVFSRVVNASNSVSPPIRSTATFVRIVKKNTKITTPNTFNTIPPIFHMFHIICYSYRIYPVFSDHLSHERPPFLYLPVSRNTGINITQERVKSLFDISNCKIPVCSIVLRGAGSIPPMYF